MKLFRKTLATLFLALFGVAVLFLAGGAIWTLGVVMLTVGQALSYAMETVLHWIVNNWHVIAIVAAAVFVVGYALGETLRKAIVTKRHAKRKSDED